MVDKETELSAKLVSLTNKISDMLNSFKHFKMQRKNIDSVNIVINESTDIIEYLENFSKKKQEEHDNYILNNQHLTNKVLNMREKINDADQKMDELYSIIAEKDKIIAKTSQQLLNIKNDYEILQSFNNDLIKKSEQRREPIIHEIKNIPDDNKLIQQKNDEIDNLLSEVAHSHLIIENLEKEKLDMENENVRIINYSHKNIHDEINILNLLDEITLLKTKNETLKNTIYNKTQLKPLIDNDKPKKYISFKNLKMDNETDLCHCIIL